MKLNKYIKTILTMLIIVFSHNATFAQWTLKTRINASTNDAEERQSGGTIDITSSDIELVNDGTTVGNQFVGLRFANVNIPKDAIIKNVYIQFAVDEITWTAATSVNIAGESADNSSTFSTAAFNISTRTKTTASVAWNSIPVWSVVNEAGVNQRTPDLSNIVKEIINRSNWKSNNAITFIITGTGRRNAHAYDGVPTAAPELVIEYVPKNYVTEAFPFRKNALWMISDSGTTKPSTWTNSNFVDTTWKFSFAPLGYGNGGENTLLNYGADTNNKFITTYLRSRVSVTDSANIDSTIFNLLCDDGAVIYVNGVEAFRHNMNSGTLGYSSLANKDVTGTDENTYFQYRTGIKLRQGINTIGVELHQADKTSNDLGFDLEITSKKPPMKTVAFPVKATSEWYYNDKGVDLTSTNWKDSAYNNKSWEYGAAPLGYGDPVTTAIGFGPNSANKYITTYLRKQFNISNLNTIGSDSILLAIRRDDGAVIYINGNEAWRTNMPTGAIDFKTTSSSIIDGAFETAWNYKAISKSFFKNGINQIAISLHQRDSSSSDLSFDLELLPYPEIGGKCKLLTDAHISCFASIRPTAQTSNLVIPTSTHRFQHLVKQGDAYTQLSGTVPTNFDYTAYVGRNNSSTDGVLCINHENSPGGVSRVFLHYIDSTQLWKVDSIGNVNFNNVASTVRNCSGGVSPWGTVITAEESTNTADINGDGYHDIGWLVEFDPWTGKIKQYGNGKEEKLWALGKMNHENVVVSKDSITAYFGEDGGTQCMYKFIADKKGDLSSGKLFGLKLDQALNAGEPTGTTAKWILIPNTTPTERNAVATTAASLGCTNFNGVEDVEINPLTGKIFFASKGLARVYQFTDKDTTLLDFETYVGGSTRNYLCATNSGLYSEPWGTGNDNLTFDDKGNLYVLQDGGRNHFWLVRAGHSQANPKVELMMTTPLSSEPTGMTFTPDFKFMFFSIQHPSASNIAQIDATGRSVDFKTTAAVALARKEFLGANLPKADFVSNKIEIFQGETISFTDLSQNKPLSRKWTFEGGQANSSTSKTPMVTYPDSGYFRVKLVVSNAAGSDSIIKISYINVKPIAPIAKISVSKQKVLVNEMVDVLDISIGAITNREWTLQSITPSKQTIKNLTLKYNDTGKFKIVLKVWNRGGISMDSSYIYVGPNLPKAGFKLNKFIAVIGEDIMITDTSKGYISSKKWTIPGATIKNQTSTTVTVSYPFTGLYTVSLLVKNSTGADSIEYKNIILINNPKPTPLFSANKTEILESGSVVFQNLSTGKIDGQRWFFPGGFPSTSNDQNPFVYYENPGKYDVTLSIFNESGTVLETKKEYIWVKAFTSVKEGTNQNTYTVYPNPISSQFFTIASKENNTYKIIDITGKILQEGSVNAGDTKIILSENIINGLYFMQIGNTSFKLMIEK